MHDPRTIDVKTNLSGQVEVLSALILELAALFPGGTQQAEHWRRILENLQTHFSEDRCRVAVVGTVKSGKSTLINSLLGRDLLKRGAGIVTAMITRVESGSRLQALLLFKNWEEVNGELNSALSFFPSPMLLERKGAFDIRRQADRELLVGVLAQVNQDQLLSQDMMDKNYVLVQSFLEGYSSIQEFLDEGRQRLELSEDQVVRHQQMVAHEALAVYLRDARLTAPFPWPAQGMELGDCQGSDSPIPQHLAQVQNYLIGADLVIYVISSRVGLRQADYKFLTDLKRMRLWDNCVFVINLDLNELEDATAAQKLVQRWQRELAAFQAEPPVFAFSALDNLLNRLKQQGVSLTPKDLGKLLTWESDAASTEFSRNEAARFEGYLREMLANRQTRLLLSGSLGQLQTVSQGVREWIALQNAFLSDNVAAFQTARERLERRRWPLESLMSSLGSAMQGGVQELKLELRQRLDRFFDFRHGDIGPIITRFIENYEGSLETLEIGEQVSAFMSGVYLVYQTFQQRLLLFLTEEINLKILDFIRLQEEWLQKRLTQVLEPLLSPLQDALNLYYQEIEGLGIPATAPRVATSPWTKPEALQPKLFSLEISLSWRIRSEALLRFGINLVGEALGRLKKLWRKQASKPKPDRLRASLADALQTIKTQTLGEMAASLLDYNEGLKFRYFFPLLEHLAQSQESALKSSLTALLLDFEGFQEALTEQSHQKAERRQQLVDLARRLEQLETASAALAAAASQVG
ncbi:hypothetical protein Desac_2646 [Desulfobacca acetoxidans DSM 11109]|uniref:Dynamin N-terminal domain-containing protein n=1 Tax=Desulfobacca acetoxidans (strain ATCC 700848 / DSM 11109 / ASRB2) TaxID=880072 RepID=F2NDW4_DESAR|nr:hypothetical protein Desac_2646 [Desulfobacca acetoxidans DSM 11109]